ncbi:MAG: hypothetical protein M5U08_19870 [Burkholderiales bacterium]|nr:hypothetical protein [Burkholderiales bacterium]
MPPATVRPASLCSASIAKRRGVLQPVIDQDPFYDMAAQSDPPPGSP